MADKQSLYELLGLSDKASPEDIQIAYATRRQALDAQPESEEKHNRIAILSQARDLLLDRRQRAGYDRRRRDRRDGDRRQAPAPESRRWTLPVFASLLIVGAVYLGARYLAAPPPAVAPLAVATAVAPAPTPAPYLATNAEVEAVAADIAALPPPASPAPAAATSRTTATPAAEPAPRLLSESPEAATVRAIAESTYAIIGGGGLGTGVAIERDKLLTNCHVIAPNVHKGPLLAISAIAGAPTRITHAAFLVREDACVAYAPGLNAKPMPMSDAARLTRGATIYSLGFAQGRLSFSTGTLLGTTTRSGQTYLVSTNHCDQGVSGGPLVDAEGRLVGLTSGGTRDNRYCASLTAETARRVLDQTLIAIDGFPTDYLTNLQRRW